LSYLKFPKDLWEWLRDIYLTSGITRTPEKENIYKIGFWEDSAGNIGYIKFYNKAGNEIFKLTFSNANLAEATIETWNITRSE